MNNADRLAVFQAQVKNVRALEGARKQISRTINSALRLDNNAMAEVHTKLYAQLFSAWAESNFLKVLHTPHGFSLTEIGHIKKIWSTSGITQGWIECTNTGLKKISTPSSEFVPNASMKILDLIKEYVTEPSLLRNKVAHGQWRVALNSKNTGVNQDLSQKLSQLDIVKIDIWFESHRCLATIVESLIESPRRTFVGEYWSQLTDLQDFSRRSKSWNISDKVQMLKEKALRVQPR